jgi:hypothetical protein
MKGRAFQDPWMKTSGLFPAGFKKNILHGRNYFRFMGSGKDGCGVRVLPATLMRNLPRIQTSTVGEHPYFGDGRIRAFYGLRLVIFSGREAIIPESEAIIFTIWRMLRLMREAIPGNIGEAENEGKRVLVHCRGQVGDRDTTRARIRAFSVLRR